MQENKPSHNKIDEGVTNDHQSVDQSNATEQQSLDVQRIIELQKEWPDAVTERSPELLMELMQQGLVATARDSEGVVNASFYKEPLNTETDDPENIIYRWGGLVSASDKESKKAMVELFIQQTSDSIANNDRIILKGSGEALTKLSELVTNLGWIKLSYEECEERFPQYLNLYLKKSQKPAEYYEDKTFFVLHPLES